MGGPAGSSTVTRSTLLLWGIGASQVSKVLVEVRPGVVAYPVHQLPEGCLNA